MKVSECFVDYNAKGIHLTDAYDCIIRNNTVLFNTKFGIACRYVNTNNDIYWNKIGWNGEGVAAWSNALDNLEITGFWNNWDDGISLGNYWSDYSGTGVYTIPGVANAVDNYPQTLDASNLPTTVDFSTTEDTTTEPDTPLDDNTILYLSLGVISPML